MNPLTSSPGNNNHFVGEPNKTQIMSRILRKPWPLIYIGKLSDIEPPYRQQAPVWH